ncbi:hypothetical protein [Chryseobacterium sp. JV558]|uniref:hypothetical protein n=1 Tax=Chryseobacterium sp. JV558 TaxID=2663236 RepID=UPI00299CD4A1|nr:hypothetical protein [Chryseobacterium sp. JV558]MDW9379699.1 hypothetical protein [Chryseobacterium sp. JV558]
MDKIVFFSKEDLASYPMMNSINEFLLDSQHEKSSYIINEILQFYHICEYIDNGFTHQDWDDKIIKQYRLQIKDLKKIINLYFNKLTSQEIIDFYDDIDFNYQEAFWLLINRFEIYKRIKREHLDHLFQKDGFNINDILYCNRIVLFFEKEIRDYLLSNEKNIEILLDYYESSHDNKPKEKFFPKSLTLSDREDLINQYLESDDPNLNYVRLIERSKDQEFLKVSDKTRLKAKRLSKKLNDEIFDKNNAVVIGWGVTISKDQEEISKMIFQDDRRIISYSEKGLLKDTNRISLFRNFKTVFGLIDFQGCIDLVSKSSKIDSFERIFMRSKNEFLLSHYFEEKILLGNLKFGIYKHFLKSLNIKIEELLEYFVNDYINNKFGIDHFKLYLPNLSGTPLEKIRLIVPEFESLIEQYKLYVHDDYVDYELLQITTKTSGFEKIPSLMQRKYVYPTGEGFSILSHNFFSNTSFLFEYGKYGKQYTCFYHLILSENITIDHFENNRKGYIQRFIDDNYLKVDENGYIKPENENLLNLIGILYNNDVISYWHFPEKMRKQIDEMESHDMVGFSGSLFSRAEQDYFNFYLNNRFSNGLWLRNKYVHATNSHNESEQENDYNILVNLLVLLVLKIENDLNIARSIIVADMNKNSLENEI